MEKTRSWEEEYGFPFLYDGVRLLDMLEEYSLVRQEKEEEKRRARAEVEVERLDALKASKTRELVIKKKEELDEICRQAHMDADPSIENEKIMAIIDSGMFDPSELLASMDLQISKAKEDALSRTDIMEKVEKWMSACEEESWLEDYSRDQNRYNATRGAHLNLKQAERARVTVNKLPALVDSLMAKTRSWEEEYGFPFLYDGVRLLDMLEEYSLVRQEKEEEKRRARAEVEVERLDALKASKTRELVIKKKEELDEICRQAHMDADPSTENEKIMAIIDSGMFDPSELLASMDLQISKAKEDALSRTDIMEKVEKWMSAYEEESWLEDYSRDQNRYNATRGGRPFFWQL
ncbi:hypothetical protein KP509_04G033000 [Ceratopteris richardii]|uniref:Uncharacterized protein n=1 Tax=Ceratopteris richardii TaxID=49495 RepID=A0A8T2UVW9_CERRI|nr:hypothetical protein KP509_04G033000 [Ceratopteris richardii]